QKRQAEAQALITRLAVGQQVMTTAGIFGQLVAVEDETVQVVVAPGVEIKYAKGAIARILDEEAAVVDAAPESEQAAPGADEREA
ncbi:MAG: Preprotein translocase subunit YajC, partial [Actinomycetota bacterium]|nr:Preprotein translocase subunit YajC [Actinomycetota bacterium]